MTPALLGIYLEELKDQRSRDVRDGVDECIRRERFFPKLAVLLEAVEGSREDAYEEAYPSSDVPASFDYFGFTAREWHQLSDERQVEARVECMLDMKELRRRLLTKANESWEALTGTEGRNTLQCSHQKSLSVMCADCLGRYGLNKEDPDVFERTYSRLRAELGYSVG